MPSSAHFVFVSATVTFMQKPLPATIPVNHTQFLHCYASYDPKLDVTYAWYQGEMFIEFERIYRLGENRYQIWYNPHFKRVSDTYSRYFVLPSFAVLVRWTLFVVHRQH